MNGKIPMTTKGPSDRTGPPRHGRAGFQAQIKGASLADLVQMECLAGSHRVVRVTSGLNTGYLYFRGGAVVHAATRTGAGEAAALDILSWNEGTFEAVDREWPAKDTIASGWQSLLLLAAQRRDERHVPSVVAIRADAPNARSAPPPPEVAEFQAMPIEVAGRLLRGEDFDVVIRLDAEGAVSCNQGGSQDFADIVAYACRLTELIGAQLGAERFVAMECAFKSGRCFIALEPDGNVVALRPRANADCSAVRNALGL